MILETNQNLLFHLKESSILRHIASNPRVYAWLRNPQVFENASEFIDGYMRWIASCPFNEALGINTFQCKGIVNDTLDAIIFFCAYADATSRRMRAYRGEHPFVWSRYPAMIALDDEPVRENDAVVLSFPFHGNGLFPEDFPDLARECEKLGVPIFLDCGLMGLGGGFRIDLSHPAIFAATFSTRRTLCAEHWSSGLMLSKDPLPFGDEMMRWGALPGLNMQIALDLFEHFEPAHLFRTFASHQKTVCGRLGLEESACVHIAFDRRNGEDVRVDISEALMLSEQKKL